MAQNTQAHNPVIYADVPDMSIIRVGSKYYMSSTTMHMSPGVPIMESTDLVNWKMISYAYQTLDTINSLSLKNGESTYGRGSWASCLRYTRECITSAPLPNQPAELISIKQRYSQRALGGTYLRT
jgi:beta-xylosidase